MNNSVEENNDIDIDIENDYYEFKESLHDRPYQYILKYMITNKILKINLNNKEVIKNNELIKI